MALVAMSSSCDHGIGERRRGRGPPQGITRGELTASRWGTTMVNPGSPVCILTNAYLLSSGGLLGVLAFSMSRRT
jgi:hypothetical protein